MAFLRIKSVEGMEGFRLTLRLSDETIVERDIEDLLNGSVFAHIRRDSREFARVYVDGGALTWPNGADLCPDVVVWGGAPPQEPGRAPDSFLRLSRPAVPHAAMR